MVRLQLTAGGVKILEPWDRPGNGRSVYLCPDPDCFDKALRQRAEGGLIEQVGGARFR